MITENCGIQYVLHTKLAFLLFVELCEIQYVSCIKRKCLFFKSPFNYRIFWDSVNESSEDAYVPNFFFLLNTVVFLSLIHI